MKCDLNKVALSIYWNHTSARLLSCKFVAYFQNTFLKEHLWGTASFYMNEKMKKIFTPTFMVPLRRAIKLSNYLAKVFHPFKDLSVHSSGKAKVAKVVVQANKIYSFNCNDKCPTNVRWCLIYVPCGKSVDNVRLCWKNHKNNNRKFLRGEVYMQQHLLEHIDCNNHSHFLEEMGIVFMD